MVITTAHIAPIVTSFFCHTLVSVRLRRPGRARLNRVKLPVPDLPMSLGLAREIRNLVNYNYGRTFLLARRYLSILELART